MKFLISGNEPFARVKIDQLLKDVGWKLTDGRSVLYEYQLDDGGKADYVLFDRNGRAVAVLEAKRTSKSPREGEAQGVRYAEKLSVPFIFLSNGEEIWFWDKDKDAHPRLVDTFFSQADLERRKASRNIRRDPLSVAVDGRIAGRIYQKTCIDVLCREISNGRRKMLVEMATGTGKTRTSAALMKRLFEANAVTRALFVVDRNTLAIQAEDAFVEHLPTLPCYRVPRTGRRFQDEKRITVVTLQTLVNEYANYSSGYFDLIVIDECHRSIYGKWRRALDHFDGIKIGLTATPCVFKNTDELEADDIASVRDTLRFFEVDKPTYRYQLKEAIEDGYLVPYEIYRAMTVKTASKDGFEVKRSEIDWDALDDETRQEMDAVFGLEQTITVDPNALERKFTIPERNRAIVREFRQVLENGYTGPEGVGRAPDLGKTIVFAVNKKHAEALARMFDDQFADKKPDPSIRYADFVVSGQGPDDTVDSAGKIKRFKKEQFPQILVSVNMLDTGFDCPEVVNLIMARFTHSSILYQQMRGRGTRQAPGKDRFTMFDFTGVTLRHGDEEGEHEGGAVVVRKPTGMSEDGPRKLLTLDIHDEIDAATREWVTIDEDGNSYMDLAETYAEGLGVSFEEWFEANEFNSDQERLLRIMKEQIKANADTMERFDDFRFDMPPFSMIGGFQRAKQVFGGDSNLEQILKSLNKAVFESVSVDGSNSYPDQPPTHN